MPKTKSVSARSKKMDQLYVSVAEIKTTKKNWNIFKRGVNSAANEFRSIVQYEFGSKFWKRLVNTAAIAKKTPFAYAAHMVSKN